MAQGGAYFLTSRNQKEVKRETDGRDPVSSRISAPKERQSLRKGELCAQASARLWLQALM